MGAKRAFSPHVRWTEAEVGLLRRVYATTPRGEWSALLPHRHIRAVECKANALGLVRFRKPARTRAEVLAAKRADMARRREADPDAARAYQRANHAANRERRNAALREWAKAHLFKSRANRLPGITARQLAALWRTQRGRCGLTGRKLTRSAQVDHILPKARGGDDSIGNLRWTCEAVNIAKRHMTDDEFVALCGDVMRWIGKRIQTVEEL